jgi:hypothetical protein
MSNQMLIAAVMTIACAACGRLSGASRARAAAEAQADSVRVSVVNENYYSARIHAIYAGGQRRSLGTIDGNGGRTNAALGWEPRSLVFEVTLITDGAMYLSHTVELSPGDSIELRVPLNISGSGLFRRIRD